MAAVTAELLRQLVAEGRRAEASALIGEAVRRGDAAALTAIAVESLELAFPAEAEAAFTKLLAINPASAAAHRGRGVALMRLHRPREAADCFKRAVVLTPGVAALHAAHGKALADAGFVRDAHDAFVRALRIDDRHVGSLLGLGHALRALGRSAEAIKAYRRCLQFSPAMGEAWWSLANLKTFAFDDADRDALAKAIEGAQDSHANDLLLFSFAKALDDSGDYRGAFAVYEKANAAVRALTPYDRNTDAAFAASMRRGFTADVVKARAAGSNDAAPIFVVGLPRAGSTLIEQILASHSEVDGLGELPFLAQSASAAAGGGFPETFAEASDLSIAEAARAYLEDASRLRSGRSRFVDKMPNNFFLIGFILVAFPRATIIDARRHPLDVSVSIFRQRFAAGQAFAYDLADIAFYHRLYEQLMSYWEEIAPGRVLRVHYEKLVENPEIEIRRLLSHAGLPFEECCLQFFKSDRVVRTASSEQVRRPLYSSSIGGALRYGPSLQPLLNSLGASVENYRRGLDKTS